MSNLLSSASPRRRALANSCLGLSVLVVSLVCTSACHTPTSADAEPVRHTLERSAGDCDDTVGDAAQEPAAPDEAASDMTLEPEPRVGCAHYLASWPDLSGRSDDPDAVAALESAVERMLVANEDRETTNETLEEQADDFLASWRSLTEETADGDAAATRERDREFPEESWAVEKIVEILYESDRVLSLQLEEYTYLGGAHPNTFQVLHSLDPRTGRTYTLDDLFLAGWGEPLLERSERAFRAERDLPESGSINAHGFFFPTDAFQLPRFWAVVPDGLLLHYNAYEIASYAVGHTRLTLPWADLADLVDPRGPIGELERLTEAD